jgi:hypothetical protein
MNTCEIVMVRGVQDADGYLCGGRSNVECCDCGAELCDLHSEKCDLCGETYCSMCFSQHLNQPHTKPNLAAKKNDVAERRSA